MRTNRRGWRKRLLAKTLNCSQNPRSHHSSQWGNLDHRWEIPGTDQTQGLGVRDHRVREKPMERGCIDKLWPRGKGNKSFMTNITSLITTWPSSQTSLPNTSHKTRESHLRLPSEIKPNHHLRDKNKFLKTPSPNSFPTGRDNQAQIAPTRPNKTITMSQITEQLRSSHPSENSSVEGPLVKVLPRSNQWKVSSQVDSVVKRVRKMKKKQNTSLL